MSHDSWSSNYRDTLRNRIVSTVIPGPNPRRTPHVVGQFILLPQNEFVMHLLYNSIQCSPTKFDSVIWCSGCLIKTLRSSGLVFISNVHAIKLMAHSVIWLYDKIENRKIKIKSIAILHEKKKRKKEGEKKKDIWKNFFKEDIIS